jgi:arylsulfatase A-like enzyme
MVMKSKSTIALVIAAAMLLIEWAPVFAQAKKTVKTAAQKPNIIYILADDMGYGDAGVYGQKKIETPNIDAIAKNGMRFTQHYAAAVCAPSRYILMTSINSGKAFIRGNEEWAQRGDIWNFDAMEANPALEGQLPIPDSTITVAKVLKKAGYTTALVGKWGLGGPMTAGIPNRQGFDYFFGYLCQREDHTYYSGHLWENEDRVPLNNKSVNPKITFPKDLDANDPKNYEVYAQNDYAPDLLIKAALRFIDKNKSKPFFLYFPSPLPHVSLQAPKKWVDYYHAKFGDEKPFLGGGYFPCRYPHATYAAMVSALDEQVGQLVKKLKEQGLYDNTIIMFCSDNGPAASGGVDPTWFNSGGPFKSQPGWAKGSLHEGGIREPFIVQWPGKIKAGTTSDLISETADLMPTLCQLLNINPPKGIDGKSYLPTLLNKPAQQVKYDHLYFEYPESGGQQSVRIGKWKGLRMNILRGNMKVQLFDLDNDIQELHDVAVDHPDIIKKMENIMVKDHHTPAVKTFLMPAIDGK